MRNERLDYLGDLFVNHRILERFGITFAQFLELSNVVNVAQRKSA